MSISEETDLQRNWKCGLSCAQEPLLSLVIPPIFSLLSLTELHFKKPE